MAFSTYHAPIFKQNLHFRRKEPLAFEEPWSTTWFPNLKHVCLDLSDDSRTLALLARLDPIQPTHLPIGLVRDRVVRTAQDFPSWSEDRPLNRWQMHLHEEGKFDADVKGGEGPIKEDLLGIWKFVTSFPDLQRLELPNAWQASKFLHDVRTAGYQYFANPNEGLANPKQVVLTCSAPVEGQDEPETPRKHKLAVDHEIENLRTRILENNLHGSRYGSEVQRLRIDNIDPRVFVVDTINDAPVGMQKLRVLNLNSLPRHGKKIPQWLWTLQNMQEYFETAGIPFPGDLTDAEVRIIKDVAKQALSALRIIYKNHPVWLVVRQHSIDDCKPFANQNSACG